jgi:hypothetical protein
MYVCACMYARVYVCACISIHLFMYVYQYARILTHTSDAHIGMSRACHREARQTKHTVFVTPAELEATVAARRRILTLDTASSPSSIIYKGDGNSDGHSGHVPASLLSGTDVQTLVLSQSSAVSKAVPGAGAGAEGASPPRAASNEASLNSHAGGQPNSPRKQTPVVLYRGPAKTQTPSPEQQQHTNNSNSNSTASAVSPPNRRSRQNDTTLPSRQNERSPASGDRQGQGQGQGQGPLDASNMFLGSMQRERSPNVAAGHAHAHTDSHTSHPHGHGTGVFAEVLLGQGLALLAATSSAGIVQVSTIYITQYTYIHTYGHNVCVMLTQ